ncbi:MAG: homoserine kinase [Gemmatimonadota bacterium]|jgi:homoserine kinase
MSAGRELLGGAVRVPGSTSNLGAGFDCLGLAVDRFLTARFRPDPHAPAAPVLRREGTLAELGEGPDEDLLVRSFAAALGGPPRGLLTVSSDIPVGKGLGSSAAALVAGSALADVVRGRDVDAGAAFAAACGVEGHGDNAAPSSFGGLVAVVDGADGLRALRLELHPGVGFAFVAPEAPLATRRSREVLPSSVPHALAVHAVRRVVALVRGLATADPELLREGLADELHAPHRLPLIPGASRALEAAVEAGAWGGTLSGAGSGLLLLGPAASLPGAAAAAGEALRGPVEARMLRVVGEGVSVLEAP